MDNIKPSLDTQKSSTNLLVDEDSITYSYYFIKQLKKFNTRTEKDGVKALLPRPPVPFLLKPIFWKVVIINAIAGAILSLISLAFVYLVDRIPRIWANNGYATKAIDYFTCGNCSLSDNCVCSKWVNCQLYAGQLYWIFIPAVTGLVIGILRYYLKYPYDVPGLFIIIIKCQIDIKFAISTVLMTGISIAGGASLGPELGLGFIGGGTMTYLIENKYIDIGDGEYKKISFASTITSTLAALLPSPILGLLLVTEVTKYQKPYLESIIILGVGAMTSFLTFYSLTDHSVPGLQADGAIFTSSWNFTEKDCLTGLVSGLVAGCIAFTFNIILRICKIFFNSLRYILREYPLYQSVIPTVLGGLIMGVISYITPLAITNGNMTIPSVVIYGYQGLLSTNLMVLTVLSKLFMVAISMTCGFIGGYISPFYDIGALVGVTVSTVLPNYTYIVLITCFMVSSTSAHFPIPFTITGTILFLFSIGLYETAPIFIAAFISYWVNQTLFFLVFDDAPPMFPLGPPQPQKKDGTLDKDKSLSLPGISSFANSPFQDSSKTVELKEISKENDDLSLRTTFSSLPIDSPSPSPVSRNPISKGNQSDNV